MLDVCKQYPWQFGCQNRTAKHTRWHSWVNWMISKIAQLFLLSFFNTQLVNDIFLCPIFDTDKSKSQINFLVHNHSFSVGSSVHNINLCYDTDCPHTLRVEPSGSPDTLWSCHICVSWYNTEDDCSCIRTISFNHTSCDKFNPFILASDRNQSNSW